MKLNWKFLFVPALALLAFGCAGEVSSDTAISRPAAEEDSRELPVNTSPGADGNFDPAKAAAATPMGPTTCLLYTSDAADE